MYPSHKQDFLHKSIRDPLYGFIGISKLEESVIDSQPFRKLQFVKQLSHAYVAYPTAIHTRFEHSLGTAFVANEMAKRLGLGEHDTETVRLAALLHDVGHGPFSHLFEQVVGWMNPDQNDPHEKIGRIIINEDEELKSILGDRRKEVTELLEWGSLRKPDRSKSLQAEIVSGDLDADKMDYLRRDSYHIGVSYGQFDLSRILHTITPSKQGTRIYTDVRGKDALESYRLGRYLMNAQVYEHHARLAADRMFIKAAGIAMFEECILDKNLLKLSPLGANRQFLRSYTSLDDNSIYHKIMDDRRSKTSKEILTNIRRRKLLKRACDFNGFDLADNADVEAELLKMSPDDMEQRSGEIAKSVSLMPHEVIMYKSRIMMKLYHDESLMITDGKSVRSLDATSPISSREENIIRYYVYGPADRATRDKIAQATADMLGVDKAKIAHCKK